MSHARASGFRRGHRLGIVLSTLIAFAICRTGQVQVLYSSMAGNETDPAGPLCRSARRCLVDERYFRFELKLLFQRLFRLAGSARSELPDLKSRMTRTQPSGI